MSRSNALTIESTRCRIVTVINQINQEAGLSAIELDGILSSILADLRNQKNAELIVEMMKSKEEEEKNAETQD